MADPIKPQVGQRVLYVVMGGRSDGQTRPAVIVAVPEGTDGVADLRVFLNGPNDHGATCYGDASDPNLAGWAPDTRMSDFGGRGTWRYDPTDPPHGGMPTPTSGAAPAPSSPLPR